MDCLGLKSEFENSKHPVKTLGDSVEEDIHPYVFARLSDTRRTVKDAGRGARIYKRRNSALELKRRAFGIWDLEEVERDRKLRGEGGERGGAKP